MQKIIYSTFIVNDICSAIDELRPDRVVLLTDKNTHELCRPLLGDFDVPEICIEPLDVHKNLDSLQYVWTKLQEYGCTRHSLMINLGGGMVTDLGGFAAATFKRGMKFINVPTTLLAMVDAAVGGKTGINFGGLKNEIGAFADASAVIINTNFLSTLDDENLRSGYAEMLKHALLDGHEMWERHINFDLSTPDLFRLQSLVRESIEVKQRIVESDPHESGLRKALNFGHTAGHAFESLLMQKEHPVLHGYAVAWGIAVELFICAAEYKFPTDIMRKTAKFITTFYGRPSFTCDDYEELYLLMKHDKKNIGDDINFALLANPGGILLDCHIDKSLIEDAFDFLREA